MGKPDVRTLLFCFYEFAGFMGVGPSRLALRSDSTAALRAFLPSICMFGLIMVLFLLTAVIALRNRNRQSCRIPYPSVACSILGILSMEVVGVVTGMRVLARHWMPALPVLLLIFAQFSEASWKEKLLFRSPCILFLVVCMGSAFFFRFSPRHAKDDYRSASFVAQEYLDRGKTVWWAADGAAVLYYGVSSSPDDRFYILMGESDDSLDKLPPPDLVVFSKPDVYDHSGALRRFLEANTYSELRRIPSFSFFKPDSFFIPHSKRDSSY